MLMSCHVRYQRHMLYCSTHACIQYSMHYLHLFADYIISLLHFMRRVLSHRFICLPTGLRSNRHEWLVCMFPNRWPRIMNSKGF